MSKRKGPAQSGHNAKPFDWHAYERERKKAREEYLKTKGLQQQLRLPLEGVQRTKVCPDCGCRKGVRCPACKSTGFVPDGYTPVTSRPEVECRRCWGVGFVANTEYATKTCPECNGLGRVEAPVE